MNTKFLIGISIVGGLLLGGCQTAMGPTGPASQSGPAKPGQTEQSTMSANPTAKPAPKSDADEVKAIEEEFNNIDASKDFPDFTVNDLQQ